MDGYGLASNVCVFMSGTEKVIKELSPTNNLVLSYTGKFFEAFK